MTFYWEQHAAQTMVPGCPTPSVRATVTTSLHFDPENYNVTFFYDVARVPGVACMNPSKKGEGLVRAGIILCRHCRPFPFFSIFITDTIIDPSKNYITVLAFA